MFIIGYHASNLIAAGVLGWFLIRNGQALSLFDRVTITLSSFILFESLNFLWLVKIADDLFQIRGQGLEIGMWHLKLIGPLFVLAAIMSLFTTEKRLLCLAFCFAYIVLGGIAILIA
jgi:hypothetical protein